MTTWEILGVKFNHLSKIKRTKDRRKIVAIVAGVALLIVVSVFVMVRQWYHFNLQPLSTEYSEQITVIESGSSRGVIAEQLESERLIRNARVFDWYVKTQDSDRFLQAGTYKLSPSFSTEEIAEIILNGRVDTSLVTIAPGRRVDQVAASLIDQGFSEDEVQEAINGTYTHPLFKDKPVGTSLEGYIFPETYQITNDSTATSVLEHSFDTFYSQLTNELMSGISARGLNLYEAITLASIVQKEVSDPIAQRQVAQVFLKRLNEGIVLGSDVTFIYAAEAAGDQPTVDYDSPYNTRIHAGLPPGPISNFNLSALEAVANPAGGDYLYFVTGDDGITYFSNTLAEHEANVAAHCIELCRL